MENNREILKIVVVGHVDHGKSTLIGRLLYDTKSIPEGAIERVKRISKEKGKPFEYAYLLDAFEEEQKQGITIDTTQLQFQTEKRDYVIIDAPGHKEFLKNMISGAANAEAALLLIDANEGIQEQSKRHGYILSLLGIQKIYVIVNKMDLIDYSEQKFDQIKYEMNQFLNDLGVYPLKYIPISAFNGENMTFSSNKMPWYKGESIIEAMDIFEKDKGLEDKPLRFPIQDVYKFDNRRIIVGRIEAGKLNVGDKILINPSNKTTRVKTIEYWQEKDKTDTVSAGMSVGITVEDEFFNKRGELISHEIDSPKTGNVFKANLFWLGKTNLARGKKYKIKLVTQEVECQIETINRVIDATTLATLENASEVKLNDVAEVTIRTKETISFDEFKKNHITGRFVIVDGYDVAGGGIISSGEIKTPFVNLLVDGEQEIQLECLDDFYFVIPENTIKKAAANANVYYVGDKINLTGDTFRYPLDIDIVDLNKKTVAQIREESLIRIIPLDSYEYENIAIIDSRGLELKINSKDDLTKFKNEFQNDEQSLNRWLHVTAYKNIKIINQDSHNMEYYL
ncbi:sulfate adenylyltransferase subunit 1 [Clostridium aminobutyricum]|uniref:sulfate adenylyltransferase n=1 Tax=Clostridium aminobutyricum TaxID=33953 RepID=A0A939IG32_CLOAM|nr:GTP-binding protein [Clostridium aminobutyricum]MBN7772480.1 GTP-binding protein [Clostridium aminobutyricum]